MLNSEMCGGAGSLFMLSSSTHLRLVSGIAAATGSAWAPGQTQQMWRHGSSHGLTSLTTATPRPTFEGQQLQQGCGKVSVSVPASRPSKMCAGSASDITTIVATGTRHSTTGCRVGVSGGSDPTAVRVEQPC